MLRVRDAKVGSKYEVVQGDCVLDKGDIVTLIAITEDHEIPYIVRCSDGTTWDMSDFELGEMVIGPGGENPAAPTAGDSVRCPETAVEFTDPANVAKKYDTGKAPVVRGFLRYFPRTIKGIATVSQYGAIKYEVSYEEKNFEGLDGGRLVDADGRHLVDEAIDGLYDPESGLLHCLHHAWEACAYAESVIKQLEAEGKPLRVKGSVTW